MSNKKDKDSALVIGNGMREHALQVLLQKHGHKTFVAPGNGGTENNIDISVDKNPEDPLPSFQELAKQALKLNALTIVGSEWSLTKGIKNYFADRGLPLFGPSLEASVFEGKKSWAKQFLRRWDVPTAEFYITDDRDDALHYIMKRGFPTVIKYEELAGGKAVSVCRTRGESKSFLDRIYDKEEFGKCKTVVIEDYLKGEEGSFMALSDSKDIVPLATSQDHKPVGDNDTGPNTGGMGAYSPAPVITGELYQKFIEISNKINYGMKKEGRPFTGVIYLGAMIVGNTPYILDTNERFGSPEIEAVGVRMESDLYPYFKACEDGTLHELEPIIWKPQASVCVVIASKGYPGHYGKGKKIFGLDKIEELKREGELKDFYVFHGGTKKMDGEFITDGGRILGVTALGDGILDAIDMTYKGVYQIEIEGGAHFRTDIGRKALRYLNGL